MADRVCIAMPPTMSSGIQGERSHYISIVMALPRSDCAAAQGYALQLFGDLDSLQVICRADSSESFSQVSATSAFYQRVFETNYGSHLIAGGRASWGRRKVPSELAHI